MPLSESYTRKIERNRRPAVHITYDVELDGATQQKELPFVVGVIADLSGKPKNPLVPLKQRKFVTIDRDNFDEVVAGIKPRVSFRLDDFLRPGTSQAVTLEFKGMADFEPAGVARQVEPLAALLTLREQLSNLLNKMDGNERLDDELQKVVWNNETLSLLSREAKDLKNTTKIEDH